MTSDSTIREALPSEADLITGIALRSKAYWGYDDAFIETFRPELTVTPETIEQDHVVLIEHERRPAGFMHLRRVDQATLELASLFIDTWAIRQGLGQRLWNYAVAYARQHGLIRIELEADPNAESFYAKQGAEVVRQQESTLKPGRVLNIMQFTVPR